MLLHGARAEGEEREGRREGDAREDQRHAEVRRAGRAALAREKRECAEPLERPENESALHGPRRPRAPHEEEKGGGQGHGDQREVSRAEKVRAEDEERESRGEKAQGHGAHAAYAVPWTEISAFGGRAMARASTSRSSSSRFFVASSPAWAIARSR